MKKIRNLAVFSLMILVFCTGCAVFSKPAVTVKEDPVSKYFIGLNNQAKNSVPEIKPPPETISHYPQEERKLSDNGRVNKFWGIAIVFLIAGFGLLKVVQQRLSGKKVS